MSITNKALNLYRINLALTAPAVTLALTALAWIVFPVSTAVAASLAKAETLQPYQASYTAEFDGLPVKGEAERSLKKNNDGSWSLDFEASMLVFSFTERSRFQLVDGKVRPLTYNMRKGSFGKSRTSAVTFIWDKKQADSSEKDRHWTLALKRSDQDKISYQQQLQLDLNSGKQQFSYPVIDGDERDDYTFQLDGEETLTTPLGQLDTVRLKRIRERFRALLVIDMLVP